MTPQITDLSYSFLSAMIGWIVSEAIPAITKGRYGGILHLMFSVGGKLYGGQDSVADLKQDVADLQAEVERLKHPADQPKPEQEA